MDLGVNFFDTAEAYGPYTNEELLGRALKGCRTSHCGDEFGWDLSQGAATGTNSRPEHIREVADASLLRLGIDHIDLSTSIGSAMEDVAGAVRDLVREGKVRFFGLSEAGVETFAEPMPSTPSARYRANIPCGSAISKARSSPCCGSSGLTLCPSPRLAGGS